VPVLQLLILLVLGMIFVQDIKSRAVHWVLFPVLLLLFVAERYLQQTRLAESWQAVLINIGFLLTLLLIVSAYFSFREGRWVNITVQLLGWGDILFLFSITFYLSVLNFLFFYIGSLILILLGWTVWQLSKKNKDKHIPLAGLQALLLGLFLACDWCWLHLNINTDDWLLKILLK